LLLASGCELRIGGEKVFDDAADAADAAGDRLASNQLGGDTRQVVADLTLRAGDTFVVEGDTRVVGARLRIEPGVTLVFGTGAQLSILDGGSIVAVGTPDDPITFRGSIQEPGHWGWVSITTNDPENELGFVRFAHGGGDDHCCRTGREPAMVYLEADARARIHDSAFEWSASNALAVEGGAAQLVFERNAFSRNEGAPVRISADLVGALDAASDYAGDPESPHGDPFIELEGSEVRSDQSWSATNLPIRARGGVQLAEARLTLQPGAHVIFEANEGLEVPIDSMLSAVGTAEERVLLEGTVAGSGTWLGVLWGSNDPDNRLAFVDLVGGGADDFCCATGREAAALVVEGSARLGITDVSVRDSGSWGMQVRAGARMEPYARNSFAGSRSSAVLAAASVLTQLDADSTYVGNGTDRIDVRGNEVVDEGRWPALDVPYLFLDDATDLQRAITIAPGAHLSFADDAGLWVSETGSLEAIADGQAITFDGLTDQAGVWKGLAFASGSARNVLDGVTIDAAGSRDWCCATGRPAAAVLVEPNAQLSVTNSTISRSAGWGVFARTGYLGLTESNNTFADVATGEVSRPDAVE
jgi:hypothetical protein